MRIAFLLTLLIAVAGCSGNLIEPPLTSASGLAFMTSRDLGWDQPEASEIISKEEIETASYLDECEPEPFDL